MAAPIALATRVDASPETIFEALTQASGLASFWTADTQVVGSVIRMAFHPTGLRLDFRVDELEPSWRVVWTPLNDLTRGPGWTGKTVTWDLTRQDGGTEVLVQQGTWPDEMPQTELATLAYLWSQVLRTLKAYVETGTPQPIFPGKAGEPAR